MRPQVEVVATAPAREYDEREGGGNAYHSKLRIHVDKERR